MKSQIRTIQELERDMDQNALNQWAASCLKAIEAGNANDARAFALAAIRASYRLAASQKAVEHTQARVDTLARIARLEPVGMLIVKGVV